MQSISFAASDCMHGVDGHSVGGGSVDHAKPDAIGFPRKAMDCLTDFERLDRDVSVSDLCNNYKRRSVVRLTT